MSHICFINMKNIQIVLGGWGRELGGQGRGVVIFVNFIFSVPGICLKEIQAAMAKILLLK